MKTRFALATILAVITMTSISTRVHAQVQDITINNGQGTSPNNYSLVSASNPNSSQNTALPPDYNTNTDPRVVNGTPVMALGYLNYNCIPDKSWDLEAFGYNASAQSLTYVGGFNPLQKNEGFSLGDIFLSSGAITQPNGLSQNQDYSNPGYSYAIHFSPPTSGSTLSYSIYKLASNTQLQTVAFNQNLDSGPYALDLNNLGSASIVVSGLTANVITDTNAQVNTLLNETLFNTTADQASTNPDNYVASFNLGSLGLSSFKASLTEQCGNDALAGATMRMSATPEPRAIYLALAAAALFLFLYGFSPLRRDQQD